VPEQADLWTPQRGQRIMRAVRLAALSGLVPSSPSGPGDVAANHAWAVLAIVALASALLVLVLVRLLRRWRGSWRARHRAARAAVGEADAAVLLRRAGFRIVATQARTRWAPLVDGEPHEVELRADYLVEAGGELLVAEVKTGDEAPQLTTAATRRQLLEYHVAFAADGVLLVCPERGTIHRVEFPTAPRGASRLAAGRGGAGQRAS
jgi:hypothetical protein